MLKVTACRDTSDELGRHLHHRQVRVSSASSGARPAGTPVAEHRL